MLVVPVCTYREENGRPFPGQDDSCILPAGCHPFIKQKSYIRYYNAKAMSLVEIFNGKNKGILTMREDFAPALVQDMQRGAEESPFLPEEFRRFFNYFLSSEG